jgi:hypothetical protein
MDSDVDEVVRLAAHCRETLGDPAAWKAMAGYPESLALCVIDSLQSTGPHYSSVVNVVQRYRRYRRDQGARADADGVRALLASFEELGGAVGWAERIGNQNRTYARKHAPLKAQAILQAAERLGALHIDSVSDLRTALADGRAAEVERAWRGVVSQSSGITWSYFLMLAGHDGVKVDRMILRYVSRAVGADGATLSPERSRALVTDVAAQFDIRASTLDHAVWRFESGRDQPSQGVMTTWH